jgi:hypothetical protein
MPEERVLTPGGFRPKSLVHLVERADGLRSMRGFVHKFDLTSRALVEVPNAELRFAEVPALGSGWITYAFWNNGTGNSISSFKTTWQVPAAPATPGDQTIFLFNGIQNYGTNFGILQPVLQWGPSAGGGGQFWAISSWYVTSGGHAYHTDPIQVNAGDTLIGVMTLTGQSGTLFNYDCEFQGIAATKLTIQDIAELLWCNETLEAYTVNQCSDYPASNSTALRGIGIQTGNTTPPLIWTPVNMVTDCGQHCTVVSNSATNGEVDIYYR